MRHLSLVLSLMLAGCNDPHNYPAEKMPEKPVSQLRQFENVKLLAAEMVHGRALCLWVGQNSGGMIYEGQHCGVLRSGWTVAIELPGSPGYFDTNPRVIQIVSTD